MRSISAAFGILAPVARVAALAIPLILTPAFSASPVEASSSPDKVELARALMRQSSCFRLEVDNKYIDTTQWTNEGERTYQVSNGQYVSLRNTCTQTLFVTSDCDVGGRHLNETEAVGPEDSEEMLETCTYSLGRSVVAAHWRD